MLKRKYLSQNIDCLRDGYTGLVSRSFVVHLPFHVVVPGEISSGMDYPGVRVVTHRHLVLRLRIYGSIPALPPHILMT